MTWPFPPPGGPVPATPQQMRAWERRQRQQERKEHDKLPPAPFIQGATA